MGGTDFARIRLFIHNSGAEALPEYDSEICIERKLTKNAKNGSSTFKILDPRTMKCIKSGLKPVRCLVSALGINVENPCVVLKQASKLDNFEKEHREATANVKIAKQQQKETKGSAAVIRQQFIECKQQFDIMTNMQQQQNQVNHWKKCEKWIAYQREANKLSAYETEINCMQQKIEKGRKQFVEKKEKILSDMTILKELKAEIEKNGEEETEKFKKPILVLKQKQSKINQEIRGLTHKISSKQRFVDASN